MNYHSKHITSFASKGFLGLILVTGTSNLAAVTFSLPGNSSFSAWENLTNTNPALAGYPTFFTFTDPWPAPIAPNVAGSDLSPKFDKTTGGGYPGSSSLYSFTAPGTFTVSDDSPILGMKTLIFQMDYASDFASPPTLLLNGGGSPLAPDFVGQYGIGIGGFGGSPSIVEAWQWDLSAVGAINSYQISFTGNQHLSQYSLQIDSSDQFVQLVPEPSIALLGLGGAFAFLRRRR